MDEIWIVEWEQMPDLWWPEVVKTTKEEAETYILERSNLTLRPRRFIPAPEPEISKWQGGDEERIENE